MFVDQRVQSKLFEIGQILQLWYNVADENGFNHIWSYFGWANQTLACGSAVTGLVLFINWARKHEENTWKFGEQ